MHELSVCNALLDQVERIAREQDAFRVTRIVLRIGPLSGIEPELLRRAYPLAAAAGVAEHAELVIEETGVLVRCTACGAESSVKANRLLCKSCGDFRTRLISGDELILQRVELDNLRPSTDTTLSMRSQASVSPQ
jgi:hydrogenase nickel incorporation protein HypA/HybF